MNYIFIDFIMHYTILNDQIILLKNRILYRLKYNTCFCPIAIEINSSQNKQ